MHLKYAAGLACDKWTRMESLISDEHSSSYKLFACDEEISFVAMTTIVIKKEESLCHIKEA